MNDTQKAEQRHAEALDLCERYIKLLHKAEAERGEARAEVAQWKAKEMRYLSVDRPQAFAAGYQRGAEAMREAAASCVGSDTALLQTYRSVLEGRIRDLPVPEGE